MNMQPQIEEDASPNIFATAPAVLWQRKWLLLPPLVLCTVAGITAAYVIPAQYESSATVLIESSQLASDTNGQDSGAIDERIARARERVLSRQDLIRTIRANNLYPKEQENTPLSAIVDRMRKATSIQAVGIDDGGGMRAMQGRNTIALRMGFRYDDPVKAQIVAQQYVNRFLEVDAAAAADAAVGARTFLEEQANQLRGQINAVEGQIARIKQENGALLAMDTRMTGNPAADAARIDSEIASLEAQNAQLAISNNVGGAGDPAVAQAEALLRVARARFSESHPDVQAAEQQLAAAKAAAGPTARPTNAAGPQIAANRAQINSLRAAKGFMLSDNASQRAAAARAPAITAQVDALEKQADALRLQYSSIASRLQSAQMSARLETEQKGERLTLADPPVVPDSPTTPNRPMLIAAGIGAGAGLGLALVVLVELLFRPIRGVEALRAATGAAPLALVPDFKRRPNPLVRWLERRNRRKMAART